MELKKFTEKEIEQLIMQENITEDITFALEKVLDIDLLLDDEEIKKVDSIFKDIRSQSARSIDFTLMNQIEELRQEKKKLRIIAKLIGSLPSEWSNEALAHIIFKEKIENIVALNNIDNKEKILEIVNNILGKLIRQLNGKKENKMKLSKGFLEELEDHLKSSFPKLGNSQFKKIEKDIFQERAQQALREMIQRAFIQEIDDRYEEFGDTGTLLGNLCSRLDNFYDNLYQEISEKWMIQYTTQELQLAQKRKYWEEDQSPNEEINKEMKDIFSINYEHKKWQIIELPQELLSTIKSERATKYITRLARNGKDIRISNLVDKFWIAPEIFTDVVIESAKKSNIYFIINWDKKPETTKASIVKSEVSTTKTTTEKELTREEKKLLLIKEYIGKHKEHFNVDTCIKVMDKRWYKIVNIKAFKKNFDELYTSLAEKQAFAEELQEVIFPLNEKRNGKNNRIYQTIDLKGFNRILFFEKNTIDGIYNHNDYMRRLRNQK